MEMVNVPGGCFQMGDTFGAGHSDEKPVHEVCVSDYAIGKYDVTVGQFRAFVTAAGYSTEAEKGDGCYGWNGKALEKSSRYNWKNLGFTQADTHPVACVSWNDATAYTRWLSGQSGKNYRLPTEAEWEYACRSGGKNEKYCGGNDIDAVAWYSVNSGKTTHPAGQKQPNGLGIYDMSGNVLQWTSDWHDNYGNSARNDPQGPSSGSIRLLRGGDWGGGAVLARAAFRYISLPDFSLSSFGFRLVSPVQ